MIFFWFDDTGKPKLDAAKLHPSPASMKIFKGLGKITVKNTPILARLSSKRGLEKHSDAWIMRAIHEEKFVTKIPLVHSDRSTIIF